MTVTEIAELVERQQERELRLLATHVLLSRAAHPWLAAELNEQALLLQEAICDAAAELDDLLAGCDRRALVEVATRVRG